ncbi:MAG: 4-(cytidine 5'-diphospho)-2-C-methyl-D-erythritol kinase [Nitrospiria bacterium]
MTTAKKRSIVIKAPAKVNLYLKILNKREDGYHNICSLMQMVGLYDHLTFQESPSGIQLTTDDASLPSGRSNLIVQAAEWVQKEMKATQPATNSAFRGVSIRLVKNIPVSAGLGGGSSDAAATLIGLNRFWSLHWPREKLAEIGENLGSDLPFFFYGPAAWVTGRGEKIEPSKTVINGWVVLVNPNRPVSTAAVYKEFSKKFELTKGRPDISIKKFKGKKPALEEILRRPYNDLEKVALKAFPDLIQIKRMLKELGGKGTLMSGSGPTLFALFSEHEMAKKAAAAIKEKGSLKVWIARILKRSPY